MVTKFHSIFCDSKSELSLHFPSMACLEAGPCSRRFEILNHVVHERLPLSIVTISYIPSTVFDEIVYDRMNQQQVIAEIEANRENSCTDTSDTLEEIVNDNCQENAGVYLVLSGASSQTSAWRQLPQVIQQVSIPNNVETICDECFSECKSLLHVTFGGSSSLKQIGRRAFYRCGVREIHIPDSVEELYEACFCDCRSLSRVTFGEFSSLKLIGKHAFARCDMSEIHIPDGVEKIPERCFSLCASLSRVTFGESSSLKMIESYAFVRCGLIEIHIPDRVEKLCDNCFSFCMRLSRVIFGEDSSLKLIDKEAFGVCHINEIRIPDSVEELRNSCFYLCTKLSRVTFGERSSLKLIGTDAFIGVPEVCEISIPSGIETCL